MAVGWKICRGKLLFRSRKQECGKNRRKKIRFSFLCHLAVRKLCASFFLRRLLFFRKYAYLCPRNGQGNAVRIGDSTRCCESRSRVTTGFWVFRKSAPLAPESCSGTFADFASLPPGRLRKGRVRIPALLFGVLACGTTGADIIVYGNIIVYAFSPLLLSWLNCEIVKF